MASLKSVPPEVLNLITLRLDGAFVVRMWCAGDRLLQMKMSNGGVTGIELVDNAIDTTTRYPRFLSKLCSLKSLKIERKNSRFDDITILRRELQRLPPTLEELDLSFPEAERAFFTEDEDNVASVQGLFEEKDDEAVIGSGAEEGVVARNGRFWDLARILPRLSTLKVDVARDSHAVWIDEDASALPDTLTALRCSYHNRWTPNVLSLLPRRLQRLSLGARLLPTAQSVVDIPPQLEYLEFTSNFRIPMDVYPLLPKTLKCLISSLYDITGAELASMPRDLDSLPYFYNNNLKASDLVSLPPRLTALALQGCNWVVLSGGATGTRFTATKRTWFGGSAQEDGTNSILILPRTLTELAAKTVNIRKVDASSWPPQLRSLEVTGTLSCWPEDLENLPSSLRRLHIGSFSLCRGFASDEQSWISLFTSWKSLPPLWSLTIGALESVNFYTGVEHLYRLAYLWLPRTLRTLKWSLPVNRRFWKHLPRNLTEIHFSSPPDFYALLASDGPHLPSTIKGSSDVESNEDDAEDEDGNMPAVAVGGAGDLKWWHKAPITRLSLAAIKRCSNGDNEDIGANNSDTFSKERDAYEDGDLPVPQLLLFPWPRTLTELILNNLQTPIPAAQIRLLPRGLTNLDLSVCAHFHSDAVACLPPSLAHLSLGDVSNWSGGELADLPRNLQSLIVKQFLQLQNFHLALLPYTLVSFFAYGTPRITAEAADFFPPMLISTCLSLPWEERNRRLCKRANDPYPSPDPRLVARLSATYRR